MLRFGKLEFNYSREMTLDPKRSGHIWEETEEEEEDKGGGGGIHWGEEKKVGKLLFVIN